MEGTTDYKDINRLRLAASLAKVGIGYGLMLPLESLFLRRLHDMKVTTVASAVIFLLRTKGFACPEFTLETGPSQRAAQFLVSVSFSIYRPIGSTDRINPE